MFLSIEFPLSYTTVFCPTLHFLVRISVCWAQDILQHDCRFFASHAKNFKPKFYLHMHLPCHSFSQLIFQGQSQMSLMSSLWKQIKYLSPWVSLSFTENLFYHYLPDPDLKKIFWVFCLFYKWEYSKLSGNAERLNPAGMWPSWDIAPWFLSGRSEGMLLAQESLLSQGNDWKRKWDWVNLGLFLPKKVSETVSAAQKCRSHLQQKQLKAEIGADGLIPQAFSMDLHSASSHCPYSSQLPTP